MKKALKITGVVLAIILATLFISPFLFRDKIRQQAKILANRTLKSELNFNEMDVSFFSHFPYLSLNLTDFYLKSPDPFTGDTLISAKEIGFGIDVSSIFGKTIQVTRIYLDRARINILYNDKGQANFDVFKSPDAVQGPHDTAAAQVPGFNIEHISFKNCRVVYADPAIPVKIVAGGLNYSGVSFMTNDVLNLTSDVKIDALDVIFDNRKYIDSKPVTAKLTTKINSRDLSVNFEKNDLKIKDIPMQFSGKFNFEKDGYQVNLNFLSVMDKEFLSARFKIRQAANMWIFAKINASVDLARWAKALDVTKVDVKGFYELNLNLDGSYITGPVSKGIRNETDTVILSIPKFSLMTKFTGGYLKYASLPQSLNNINFLLNASCSDNDYRNINLQLENLQATFLKNKVAGFIRMKSLRDIPIEAGLTGSCNLAELKDVIPMDSITLAGILSVDLKVNGNYAPAKKMFPVTTALIGLKGGIVQTKYYPHPVEKTEMLLEVVNHTGTMQDLVVNIKPLSFLFEGKPFTLNARLENFDDMLYDVQSKGTLDIGKIYKVFSQKGMDLDGFIETDLSLKGRQSDATSGRIGKLSNHGTLMLRDIALRSELYPKPFIIKTGEFRFDQDKVWFDNFLAIYGTSDFHLKGFMKNTINYMLSQGGTLTGDFRMNSDFINIDEFMAFAVVDSAVISAERPETGVVIIPRDLDVNLRAGINKTSFKGLEIKDIQAEVNVKEGIIVLKNTSLEMAGCKANMDATYGSVTPVKGFFDFHIKAVDFDIKRAYNEIGMIREMAPSAGKAEGIVSMDYSIKGILNAEMFPILPSVEGGGIFSIKKVKVYGLKLFNDISKGTEKEGLSNPDMTKVDIKSTIKNNTVTLEQFKFKVKGIRVKISGTTTFDNKLNLKVRLGMGPLGIIGIPMKVTGTSENMKIRYGKGKETDETKESEYTDELSPEMLQRIRNAKEDAGDDDPEK